MIHELKIWPQYFCRVRDGSKTFEVRENDRGFQPGDFVCLREWDPKIREPYDEEGPIGYTGNAMEFKVGYIFPLDDNMVVFSLLPVTK